MGAADVVPGVSGGTIAFVTGIYEELLRSITSVDAEALRLLFRFKLKSLWTKINGSFLLVLFGGIITSIISLAKLVTFLLSTYPIQVWSFFFGLILISCIIIMREIEKWNLSVILFFILGCAAAYFISTSTGIQMPNTLLFIFFSGILAICAMILPGISGAFILLLIGKYEYMMRALTSTDIPVIATFVTGCVIGLILFARLLSWTLSKYRSISIATLAGIMLGSLYKVWPWKTALSYRLNQEGYQVPAFEKSVLPGEFLRITGQDPHIFYAILFAALGIFLVILLEKLASLVKYRNSV